MRCLVVGMRVFKFASCRFASFLVDILVYLRLGLRFYEGMGRV